VGDYEAPSLEINLLRGPNATKLRDTPVQSTIELFDESKLYLVRALMISFTDKVRMPSHVLMHSVDKEVVFLNMQTEQYSGLDETGTWMWQIATSSVNIECAYRTIMNEYDVNAATLRQNLSDLLEELVGNGLLTISSSDVETS
jgi:hypothetical protein